MENKPAHPLVVDSVTGLCRLATQEDIRGFELIAIYYKSIVEQCSIITSRNSALDKILKDPYYGGKLLKRDD
jgi:hypothetical protein